MDLLIRSGLVVDGTGAPMRRADIGITGGRVAALGDLHQAQARYEIDAQGCIVCPGFIDMHSHADLALLTGRHMDGRLRQGITTEVLGQDGLSYAPVSEDNLDAWRRYLVGLNGDAPDPAWKWHTVGEYLDQLEGRASNAVYLIAHGAVRVEVMGWEAQAAKKGDVRAMRSLVRQGLAEGAAGLATGLTYVPCVHATTDELVALCQEVGAVGGLYVTHLRSYGKDLLAAIDEAIEIGRRSGAGVHISHLRMTSPATWGLSPAVLAQIDRARDEGVQVSFDLYPYIAGCAPLFALLPLRAQCGGADRILARLADPAEAQRMTAEMVSWRADWTSYSLSNARSAPCGEWDGASLCEAAAELGMTVEAFVPRLLLETELEATIVSAGGNEADNVRMFAHPACTVGSDGVLLGKHPHPRGFGCYPRVLARYVRETGLLGWEEAIHKMTGLPAALLNLPDRGCLRQGAWADVVVLDPERVADAATFSEGRLPPAGIDWVLVNGQVVVEKGQYLGSGAGQALRPGRPG